MVRFRICSAGLLVLVGLGLFIAPVLATDTVTVARYPPGESEPEYEESFTIAWLEENLPVMGDGVTHYYLQGPVFDESEDPWNPDEDINCYPGKDMGAVRGTDVALLCDQAGGAHSGDVILIRAEDGFRKSFPYENVYTPPSRQGRMVLAWERDGQKAGSGYYEGMRLQFFADTSVNPWGEHIFGNSDMRSALPEEYWHFFQQGLPSSTGLSVQSVSRIEIYESSGGQPPVIPSGDNDGGADIWTPASGTLTVLSLPSDAAVVIDGAVSDYMTNVSIPEMPEGYYGVSVRREGYRTPDEEWVWVAEGSNASVSFTLSGITALCEVISHPAGAGVAVDGVDSGILADGTPLTLITGNHTVTLTMDGYVPLEIPVRISPEGGNRVEGVLVPLCNGDDPLPLSAGPTGTLSGSLSVAAAAGYPGFIAGKDSVQVTLPETDGEEISSYLLFSHGYDTESGLPAEPQAVISAEGNRLLLRGLANALTPAGTVEQTCALFPSPSRLLTVSGAGTADDVFSLFATVSLSALPGADTFSYVVYEGCVPAEGDICLIPADSLPNSTRTLTLISSVSGEGTNGPVISVNGVPVMAETSLLAPRILQTTVPLPPGEGAYLITATGASPGCMVRIAVADASEEFAEDPRDSESADAGVLSGSSGDGLFAEIFRFFAGLFSSSTQEVPASAENVSLPVSAGLQDVTPAPGTPAPDITNSPASPAAPAETGDSPSLTGGVMVESVPSGAWVSLDGKSTGKKTPALFAGLKEGTHRIGVSLAVTGDLRSDMAWVYPGALSPVFFDFSGSLPETVVQVTSETGDPVLFTLNGNLPEKTTPAEVTITDTDSFVAVTADVGFKTYPLDYNRASGALRICPATSGPCMLAVYSDPAGAEIFIDGKRTGETTPSVVSGLSAGPHRIVCSLKGYTPETRVLSVSDLPDDTDAEVMFTLVPYSNGALCVTSEPAGAHIYLYDRFTGLETPATISGLPIGTYEVGLSSGDETMVREATVLPDTTVTYAFRFDEE